MFYIIIINLQHNVIVSYTVYYINWRWKKINHCLYLFIYMYICDVIEMCKCARPAAYIFAILIWFPFEHMFENAHLICTYTRIYVCVVYIQTYVCKMYIGWFDYILLFRNPSYMRIYLIYVWMHLVSYECEMCAVYI